MSGFKTVAGETEAISVIERSKFICLLKGVNGEEEAKSFMDAARKRYPLANHYCYAYIADEKGNFSWRKNYPSAVEVNRSAISNRSVSTAWVFKDGDYYYMTAQGFVFSKQLYIMRSKNPWGPFEECHQLWTMPWVLDKKGTRTYNNFYMPHLHQTLSREGELVFSTNTDCKDFNNNFNATGSADFYRPFFFRVYNWKAVFEE